jgi:hypothetical protein
MMMNWEEYNYDSDDYREYVSEERFRRTEAIKPTKRNRNIFKLSLYDKKKEDDITCPEKEDEKATENTNLKLNWINLSTARHAPNSGVASSFNDSDYPILSISFKKVEKITADDEKGWKMIESKKIKEQEPLPKPTFEKTQICRIYKENKKCPHGSNCRFAHHQSELVVNSCHFGEKCRSIRFNNKEYSNKNDKKICIYKHPGETINNYNKRNKLTQK